LKKRRLQRRLQRRLLLPRPRQKRPRLRNRHLASSHRRRPSWNQLQSRRLRLPSKKLRSKRLLVQQSRMRRRASCRQRFDYVSRSPASRRSLRVR
jgi:hypothetical protein